MTDQIPGEVLVPQTRFLPSCDCGLFELTAATESFDTGAVVKIHVQCAVCGIEYREDLPYDIGVKPER